MEHLTIVVTGAPGAGKGTQASALARRRGVPHLSTGDLFRRHLAEGTDVGRAAQRHLDAGRYVPDELTNTMVREYIAETAPDGALILDGYPRTAAQVEYLDSLGTAEIVVLNLVVDPSELTRRLRHRALTGGRRDDDAQIVLERQALYAIESAPVLDAYRQRGVLVDLDGAGELHAVSGRIDQALSGLRV